MAKKILLALSGGVDSAVAALRLQRAGYAVEACYMSLWAEEAQRDNLKISEERARDLAAQLDIPFYVLDLKQYFYDNVVTPFLESYAKGETPNPCIYCNQALKFKLPEILKSEAEYFATGHYARVEEGPDGHYHLLEATDLTKDQSYMLYHLQREDLKRIILPLGHSTKTEVRAEAMASGLHLAKAPDSQDICFIAGKSHHDFLESHGCAGRPGNFVDAEGNVLGPHRGLGLYTVGQTRGLGISTGEKMAVAEIRAKDNSIVLLPKADFRQTAATVRDLKIMNPDKLQAGAELTVRVRYRGPKVACRIAPEDTVAPGATIRVVADDAFPPLSPGQAAVFYDGPEVLGGGIWDSATYV